VIFCRNDSFPVRYLGLSLGVNPSRLFTWKPVLSTIRAKLSTWKGKMSMVGMICLIKSVLSSLPLYYMSIYHMPKGIINVISSINHSFLWSGSLNSHGICNVALYKVIKSKSLGGLGLGSLYHKNLALLFKWVWNLDNGVTKGWQEFILYKYQPNFANGLHVFPSSLSPTRRLHCLAFWLKSSVRNFNYTSSDLVRSPYCILN